MITLTERTVCLLQLAVMILVTSATLVSSRHNISANQELCSEPADLRERLEELHKGHMEGHIHDTFLLVPSLRDALTTPTPLNDSATCTPMFSGSNKCVRGDAHGDSPGDPCPTYTCLNCDKNRHPRVLMETRCSCTGRCRGIPTRRGLTPACEGVFYHVRVLKRTGCLNGVYQYVSTWQPLQVGCACKLVPRARS